MCRGNCRVAGNKGLLVRFNYAFTCDVISYKNDVTVEVTDVMSQSLHSCNKSVKFGFIDIQVFYKSFQTKLKRKGTSLDSPPGGTTMT